MGKLISASDELSYLLDINAGFIKDRYITLKLYADSAIREKMRRDGIAGVGDDEIVAHLKKLEASKSRRLDKKAIRQARVAQQRRVQRAKDRLSKGEI